ncbi:YxeA family protein [Enterococcus rivorum]|uniref:YxeA family protein n=1 Tax=Enterococcus rivorum TaxID=762845 RepID=A0A1E5KYS8_9ENTE|nr:YxeA family protein [Enterococcus rivorum]MBP2097593.1 uncharacterized protein (TIGR01655 family) [Enterococcus rivorum]OEH83042.1 hypothetical protein BCR26_01865 [Enterococcus rivorum]
MRRFLTSIVAGITIVVAIIFGLYFYSYNNTSDIASLFDRINPLAKTEEVYIKVPKEYEEKFPDAVSRIDNYTYIQESYNKEGKARKLKFVSFGKELKAGKYLQIRIKGQNVKQWKEVPESEIPQEALIKLNPKS